MPSFNDYQQQSITTRRGDLGDREAMLNATLGLTGEAGEVANLVKKAHYHNHPLENAKLVDELGDVLFYVAWLADLLEVSLEEVARRNSEKLRRRYPNGFSAQASRERVA